MARYKYIDTSARFLAVDLHRQLLPGTFEHGLNHLLDHELDLTGFDTSFRNDEAGAAAYVSFWHHSDTCSSAETATKPSEVRSA
ncbi:MAG: hypothetical protein ACYCY5_02735 [Sulfuricella sp.]